MTGAELDVGSLAAAFVGGLLTSASPCVLAAVPVAVGVVVIAAAAWLWRSQAAACGIRLPAALERRLARSGTWGAVLLGALIGTVMSPCATPALAAALALAGSGAAFGASMAWGAALLLAYGIGHSALLLVAAAMPGAATALVRRFDAAQRWLPGRRSFAALLAAAGLWWVLQGLGIVA